MVPTGARAVCGTDGSIPNSPRHVYTVSAGGQTLYIDDREYFDWDDDWGTPGDNQGIWIYLESNHMPGLQTGGPQVVLAPLPPPPPIITITPIVIPADPNRPVHPGEIRLFNGYSPGQSWAQSLGEYDECFSGPDTPDTLLL
jgi:hypothetical protein